MIYLNAAQLVLVLLLCAGLYRQQRDHEADTVGREERFTAERSELITRIQRPELVPRVRRPHEKRQDLEDQAKASAREPVMRPGEVRPMQLDDVVSGVDG